MLKTVFRNKQMDSQSAIIYFGPLTAHDNVPRLGQSANCIFRLTFLLNS